MKLKTYLSIYFIFSICFLLAQQQYDDITHYKSGLIKVEIDGKQGVINTSNKVVIPIEYDYIDIYDECDIIRVEKNEKYGLYNSKGEVLLARQYDYIKNVCQFSRISNNIYFKKNEKLGFYNHKTGIKTSEVYDSISQLGSDYTILKRNNKFGIIDLSGEFINEKRYDSIGNFMIRYNSIENSIDGIIEVKNNHKAGLISTKGKTIIPTKYNRIYPFGSDMFRVTLNGKHGLYKQNQLIIPAKYDSIQTLSYNSIYKVYLNKKVGLYNQTGEIITPVKFDSIIQDNYSFKYKRYLKGKVVISNKINETDNIKLLSKFDSISVKNEFTKVYLNNKVGIYQNDRLLIPIEYNTLTPIIDNLFWAEKNNKKGILNIKRQPISIIEYTKLGRISEESVAVQRDEKFGIINLQGDLIIPFQYDFASAFEKGLAIVFQNKKWGVINKNNEAVVPLKYDGISLRSFLVNDLILVGNKQKGTKEVKWGQINKKNEIILPLIYDDIDYNAVFYDYPYQAIELNGKKGLVDTKTKKIIAPPMYDYISDHPDKVGFFEVRNNDKVGLMDTQGKLIIPTQYNSIERFCPDYYEGDEYNRFLKVRIGEKYGLIDKNNKEIAPIIYDRISVYHNSNIIIVIKDNKIGGLNADGKEIIPPIYYDGRCYDNGCKLKLRSIKDGEEVRREGFISSTGKTIVPFIYEEVVNNEESFIVLKNNKVMYLDHLGNSINDTKYISCQRFYKGLAQAQEKGLKPYIINKKGDCVINCQSK